MLSRRASRASPAWISCMCPSPLKTEGVGNAGRQAHPQPRVRWVVGVCTRVFTARSPGSPDIPHAMVYGLFRALPGDRAFLPPSPAEAAFRKLDASVEASGPHVFAVRFSALVRSTSASTASRPASVTIASRPSVGTGRRRYVGDLGRMRSGNIFATEAGRHPNQPDKALRKRGAFLPG